MKKLTDVEAHGMIEEGWWNDRMTVKQLRRYAAKFDIDIRGATLRCDVLERIELAVPRLFSDG